ncbi:hypothetical protein GCM10009819_22420 [Agromyces tropicus]|uniref:M23ase beta-sheet core domain-containing protein n=1 Tax=Agromyces tropicus TaxID=555371 RepID=A0ABN2UIU6_9MICO
MPDGFDPRDPRAAAAAQRRPADAGQAPAAPRDPRRTGPIGRPEPSDRRPTAPGEPGAARRTGPIQPPHAGRELARREGAPNARRDDAPIARREADDQRRPSAPARSPQDHEADRAGDISDLLGFGSAPAGREVRELDAGVAAQQSEPHGERRTPAADGPGAAEASARRLPVGRRTPNDRRVPDRPAPAPSGAPFDGTRPPGRGARRGTMRRLSGVIAMGFVAMLALATSVPALSLLTPEEVQAMALTQTYTTRDGQRVDISGNALAADVDREVYQTQTIEEYAQAAGIRAEATFTNNPLGTIQWPFAVGVHIGDRFGYRNCYGCSSDHHGQDFNPGLGAQIQAIADGVVSESTDAGGSLGVVMMIDHVIDGQVVTSVYAHMEYGSRRFEVGDTVEVGDVVGTTGNTGMSTGPHLHFEIRIGGKDGYWVDPLEWLYANTN